MKSWKGEAYDTSVQVKVWYKRQGKALNKIEKVMRWIGEKVTRWKCAEARHVKKVTRSKGGKARKRKDEQMKRWEGEAERNWWKGERVKRRRGDKMKGCTGEEMKGWSSDWVNKWRKYQVRQRTCERVNMRQVESPKEVKDVTRRRGAKVNKMKAVSRWKVMKVGREGYTKWRTY